MTIEPLPRSTPEAQGIPSSAVLAFLEAAEQAGHELHSVMFVRHGHVVAEGWWKPYGPQRPHLLYSLSKSFTSTAAGLAIEEGCFSLDDTVLSFFPEAAPETVSPNLAAMRVRHLLSMSTGHAEDTTRFLSEQPDGDWAKAFLARPVEHEPGTHFLYNSGATYMVSAIVQKTTGQTLLDYLRPRLFESLGIQNPAWESDPRGINVGGWGMSVRTEDITRFGELYLRRGVWQGRQLVPEAWVNEATAAQVSNGDRPDSDWSQGYGYQFWRCRHNAYRGDGAFGQYCVVMPDQDAVLAITSNVGDMQAPLNLVWTHLLPVMASSAPLPEDPAAHDRLTQHLSRAALPTPQGQATLSPLPGGTYRFAENDQGLRAITFDFAANGDATLTIEDTSGTHQFECGPAGTWRTGTTTFLQQRIRRSPTPAGAVLKVAASGAWTDADTFTARLCLYETPFTPNLTCRFSGPGRLEFTLSGAVGFGPTTRPALEARVV